MIKIADYSYNLLLTYVEISRPNLTFGYIFRFFARDLDIFTAIMESNYLELDFDGPSIQSKNSINYRYMAKYFISHIKVIFYTLFYNL